jgi:hypothetical protein
MLQVTHPEMRPQHLKVAQDQIEKYNPGVTVIKELPEGFVLYRTDMNEPKHKEKK